MYIPKYFRNDNIEEVKSFIEQNSFGILVSQADGKPWATHIPLELGRNENDRDALYGHISKGNPQWKSFADNSQVLAIFSGPHTYISSSWYDHENVPTWNYIAVHVYGIARLVEGEKLLNSLKKLVDKYEATSVNPVSVEGMSENFLRRETKGIVGFEIEIGEIQSAYKLSQNRDEKNHASIVNELQQRGDTDSLKIAAEMTRRSSV